MFHVSTQNLYEAETRMWEYIRRENDIRSDIQNCMHELKKMMPLDNECRELERILERLENEVYRQSQMAQGLSEIRDLYIHCDDVAAEYGEGCIRWPVSIDISEIMIPEYKGGVIRSAAADSI